MSDRYEHREHTYSPLEHLVYQVIQGDRYRAYCESVPAWADEMYGKDARTIARTLETQFEVTRKPRHLYIKASGTYACGISGETRLLMTLERDEVTCADCLAAAEAPR